MGLRTCSECKGQVATSAKACPHCGAKVRQPVGLFGYLFVGICVWLVWQIFTADGGGRPSAAGYDPAESARGACLLFIKQKLHDPGSADFGSATATEISDGRWVVVRDVRARNAMGALQIQSMQCEMTRDGVTGDWSLVSLRPAS